MIRYLLMIVAMFASTSAWAQITTIPLAGWAGGWCEISCGTPGVGNYDCSNGQGGWTPNVSFADAVPVGHVITQVTSNVMLLNCAAASTVTTSVNGSVIGSATTTGNACQCLTDKCRDLQAVSTTYPNGFPGYNYGGNNTFSLGVTGLVCVSHATLTIESVPAGLNVSVTAAKTVVEPNLYWCNSKGQCRTQTVSARTTAATVTVKDTNNAPVIGANVILSVERASVGFGGHDHDAAFTTATSTRPLGTVGKVTDNGDGTYTATYTAPKIAAEDIIVAKVSKGTQSKQAKSATITAQVSGLVKFNAVKPHSLIGGTTKHHGPPKNTPDNNHFATTTTNAKITKLLTLYNKKHASGLYVNDMSLPKGGLFDVGATRWSSPHLSHRRGIDMDMHTMDVKGKIIKLRLRVLNKEHKKALFKSILDEGNHLHIYF